MDERKSRSVWPWIIAGLCGLPLAYAMSIPLLNWAYHRGFIPYGTRAYALLELYALPIRWAYNHFPRPLADWVGWYARLFVDR